MRHCLLAIALIAGFAGPALAQDEQPPPDGGPSYQQQGSYAPQQPQHGGGGKMRDKFDAANTSHDGRLTQQQAQAGGWRGVARNFDQIDADHKGYVTMQDVRTWSRQKAAARRQSQGNDGGPSAPYDGGPGPGGEPPPQ